MTFFDAFWYIFNFLSIVLMVIFLGLNLTPRFNRVAVFFLILIPFAIVALSQHYFYDIPSVCFKLPAFAYFFVSSVVFFKEKLRTKLFVSTMLFTFTYLVSALLVAGGIAIGLNPYDDIMTYIISLPNTVLLIVLFAGFTYFRLKKQEKMILPKAQMLTFSVFPLSQIILMMAAMMIISYYGWFRDKNTGLPFMNDPTKGPMILICVAAALCIFADVILFYVMLRSSQNEKLQEELRYKDYQNSLNLEYYREVEKNSIEARKIRHDLANIIQTACEIVENGNDTDRESAQKIFEQLKVDVAKLKIERFCENTLVNAIAANKAGECTKHGIEYDFELTVPEKLDIEELDVCKAYVNIFDNAINAAKASDGSRYIKVRSFIDKNDDMLYITSENAVPNDYEDKKKNRVGEHGYGLKILDSTAEKYGGHLVTQELDGNFNVVFAVRA